MKAKKPPIKGASIEIEMLKRYDNQKLSVLARRIREHPTGKIVKGMPTRGEIIPKRDTESIMVSLSWDERGARGLRVKREDGMLDTGELKYFG